MMDLDSAIQSFEDEMEKQTALGHPENIDNLEQMSNWLKELKAYKEQSDDAISRQAVLKIIDGWYDNNRDTENIEDLIILITYMSSVTPQRWTGRWIDSHIPESTLCECSACGFTCGAYSFNYCPNCGAKMEVEE